MSSQEALNVVAKHIQTPWISEHTSWLIWALVRQSIAHS